MRFSSMPPGAKVGAAAVGGGAVIGAMYPMIRFLPTRWFFYVVIGMALVGVLTGLFGWLVRRARKRKAKPMEQSLRDNSAATPQGVTEPGRRARLDDLRKNFDGGVERFRAAGKNLYSLPWYVLVGEPGSGKTEAVRHCNVGFPPGLQDQLQGTGGTINMNWWFTNHAIILDTAGRLMFEEIEPGATSEWREFLKLLRANRPNCPINGMLLCIPSDSLIKDTADELERKGARIAQQLDQIQRALGVRFPVFVMVTKCDLINGFREFFEDITDPQLQHQMLGWSNPSELDQPFNPELVDQHLQTVVARLMRRRLGLLLDPISTQDATARRTDQVDALYAFPQALTAIAPRLRRYLEMIFVAGEWSAKPLFLRGIYFTSSMREGSALDADLAEALGVPVESLPEGKVWERDRAYFLRDLFMNKVFREKGLVTNATNAKRRQRRRKLVVLGASFLAVVFLALFTWWGVASFRGAIGDESDYWQAAAADRYWVEPNHWLPVVSPEFKGSTNYTYAGMNQIDTESGSIPAGRFHHNTMTLVQKEISVPGVFRFAAFFGRDINENRRRAQRVLFEAGVLRPLVGAARRKMLSPGAEWSPHATAALGGLTHLECGSVYPSGRRLDADALFRYVFNDENYEIYKKNDAKKLDDILAWTYGAGQESRSPRSLFAGSRFAVSAVDKGVEDFIAYWEAGGGVEAGEILKAIAALKTALGRFGEAEADLIALDDRYAADANQPGSLNVVSKVSGEWTKRRDAVLAEAIQVSSAVVDAKLGVRTLVETYDTTISERLRLAEKPHKTLAAAARPKTKPDPDDEKDDPEATKQVKKHLQAVAGRVEESLAGLKKKYEETQERKELLVFDPRYLQLIPIKDDELRLRLKKERLRLFELRLKMYETGDTELAKKDVAPKMAGLVGAVDAVLGDIRRGNRTIDDIAALQVEGFRFDEAAGVSKFVASRLAKRRRVYELLSGVLAGAPKTADAVAAQVTKAVQQKKLRAIPCPVIRGTGYVPGKTFDDRYHPEAAAATLAGWKTIADYISPAGEKASADVIDRGKLAESYRACQQAYDAYLAGYQRYWIEDVLKDLTYDAEAKQWKQVRADIIALNVERVAESLADLGQTVSKSLRTVRDSVPSAGRADYDDAVVRLQKNVDRLGNRVYLTGKGMLLTKWSGLPEDVEAARRRILAKAPGLFKREFLDFRKDAEVDISEKYWKELAYGALRALAREIENQVEAAYKDLQTFARFPLAAPKADATDKELTPGEVARAAAALGRVLVLGKEYPEGSIGSGETTGIAVIDDQLRLLRGEGLKGPQKRWCEAVRAVLDGLPPSGETLPCTVRILATDQQKSLSAGTESLLDINWYSLEVDQGTVKKGNKRITQAAAKDVGEVEYPGKQVSFKFFRFPRDVKPIRTTQVAGAWGAVRLLHTPKAKRLGDGRKWHVMLVVKDTQGRDRSLWIELELAKPLPRIDQWP